MALFSRKARRIAYAIHYCSDVKHPKIETVLRVRGMLQTRCRIAASCYSRYILLFSHEATNQATVQSVAQVIGYNLVRSKSGTTVSCAYQRVCIVRPQHSPRRFLVGAPIIDPFENTKQGFSLVNGTRNF